MARLIDADALLEQYNLKDATKYGNKDAEQQTHSYSTMMLYEIADMIEGTPTAYDVGKVIEKLNNIKKYNLNLADRMLDIQANGTNRHFICLEDAIEIVKAGVNA